MLSSVLKNLSILKKFLFINSIVFIIIGCGTIFYLKTVQPNLIKKKTANHIQIIDNTIDHIQRLNIKFNEDDIRKFLFSTRFLFQNLDRVICFFPEPTKSLNDMTQDLYKRINIAETFLNFFLILFTWLSIVLSSISVSSL